jgi:hypothetical protein
MRCLLVASALCAACRGPVEGSYVVRYPTGGTHWEYRTLDGVPHGRGRVWHRNGELQSEGTYDQGKKHGEFTFWDDSGEFLRRAFFWNNVEVWQTTSYTQRPPQELLDGLAAYTAQQEEERPRGILRFSTGRPAPYFATLDRTTSLSRAGLQLGFGDNYMRSELFGNYRLGRYGFYAQASQTLAEVMDAGRLSGRRTLDAGGTLHLELESIGTLSARGGLLVPIGNDDTNGFIASSMGTFERPTDAAASVPATAALRTSASLTRGSRRFVVQADAGVDWLLGGRDHAFDAMLRANAAAGVGVKSLLFSVELSNAVRVSDPSMRVHTIGLGGTLWLDHAWLSSVFTQSFDGHSAFTGVVGYEL